LPNTQRRGFTFSHTHKIETKRTIKIKNPKNTKNNIEKAKRRDIKLARKNRDK
jgi:hypothetical protein